MQMDNTEIVTNYKLAKNKNEQLQILADLNACDRMDIVKILIDGGIDPRGFSKVLTKEERECMKNNRKKPQAEVQAQPEKSSVQTPESDACYDLCWHTNEVINELKAECERLHTENEKLKRALHVLAVNL